MYETAQDLIELKTVLDRSAAGSTPHHRMIFDDKTRWTAQLLATKMTGMRLLSLATVTSKGEPRVSPVDGIFYRGRFWFGSDPTAMKFRHIRNNPAVSLAHTEGEELAVLVHGVAELVDVKAPEHEQFAACCLEIYGTEWNDFGRNAQYARVIPNFMFVRSTKE